MDRVYSFDLETYLREMRRALHAKPELFHHEKETQAFLLSQLAPYGFSVKKVNTGLIVDIKGADSSQCIALRADMDALPVTEQNDCPYASQYPGVMHACGHDGHMAMVLAVAKILAAEKPAVNTRLIFQPAEESEGGAEMMIAAGALDKADMIFALHLSPEYDAGTIATDEGAIFAGTVDFHVDLMGKSVHAAVKEQGIDALRAANDFYLAAYALYESDYKYKNLFHIGKMTGGTADNVVADFAQMFCTFRFFDDAVKESFMMRLEGELVAVTNKYGVDHRVTVENVYPPLKNDRRLVAALFESVPGLKRCQSRFTAEDFAYYALYKPAVMCWLGVRDKTHTAALHSPCFDFDESALKAGVEFFLGLVEKK